MEEMEKISLMQGDSMTESCFQSTAQLPAVMNIAALTENCSFLVTGRRFALFPAFRKNIFNTQIFYSPSYIPCLLFAIMSSHILANDKPCSPLPFADLFILRCIIYFCVLFLCSVTFISDYIT